MICKMCDGKEWMVLQQHPLDRKLDLVAPCLGCSASKNLNEIQARRNIKLVRDAQYQWTEQTVN